MPLCSTKEEAGPSTAADATRLAKDAPKDPSNEESAVVSVHSNAPYTPEEGPKGPSLKNAAGANPGGEEAAAAKGAADSRPPGTRADSSLRIWFSNESANGDSRRSLSRVLGRKAECARECRD